MSRTKHSAFTIIELLIVIVVIAILAVITVVAFNGITRRANVTDLNTAMEGVVKAMEAEKILGSGSYPTSLPDRLKPSSGVTLTFTSGDGTNYCVDGVSKSDSNLKMFVSDTSTTPKYGTCATGEDVDYDPYASTQGPGGGAGGWSMMVAGNYHGCGIYSGKLYCWGANSSGQLGNGSTDNSSVPVLVDTSDALANKTIKSIASSSSSHTCVLTTDSKVICWGQNNQGQLGDGTTNNSLVPIEVDMSALGVETVTHIAVGANQTCVIASNKRAYCWGWNYYGQLGDGTTTNRSSPTAVITAPGVLDGKDIVSINTNSTNTCVITSELKAYCWGQNNYGQVGDGTYLQRRAPVAVSTAGVLSEEDITSIAVGGSTLCALTQNKKVYCWGNGGVGSLGNAGNVNSNIPVAVDTSNVLKDKDISAISSQPCAATSDHTVACWGSGIGGALGNNSTANSNVPVAVDIGGKEVLSIASSNYRTCILTADNQIYCWGQNTYGQLGNGSTSNSLVPVQVQNP